MKALKLFGIISLLAFATGALAQTDSVTVTATKPSDVITIAFVDTTGTAITTYAIGGTLTSTGFTYGSGFNLEVTYDYVTDGKTASIAFSGSQVDYELAYAYTVNTGTTKSGVAFATAVGSLVAVSGTSDDGTNGGVVYVEGTVDATNGDKAFTGFDNVIGNGTVFKLGAKALESANTALNATVTVTATLN